MKYIGEEVDVVVALTPQTVSGSGAVYGSAFDRLNFESMTIAYVAGATGNSPTNVLLTVGLEESDTETGSYATVTAVTLTGNTYSGAAATVPGQLIESNVDLKPLKRWIKPKVTPTFTGGSSPTVLVGGVCILGEARVGPA